jgi:hypothetical protein
MDGMHHVAADSISMARDGRVLIAHSTIPIPASPPKKTKVQFNPNSAMPEEPQVEIPSQDFSEFDDEYRPGLQKGPQDAHTLVRLSYVSPNSCL